MHPLDQRPRSKRSARWYELEIWEDMHQHFVTDPDMENLILDSSVIRAHPFAAGD